MAELTIGIVAGIIAAVLLFARVSFPTALSFILAGQLKDGETAATWTAASAPLQGSYWPFWLQADQSKSYGVRRSVSFLTMSLPTLAVLVAVASVVTPLGLYEEDVIEAPVSDVTFAYARDSSAFSIATSYRTQDLDSTRHCLYGLCGAPCPYTDGTVIVSGDPSGASCTTEDSNLDRKVPQLLKDIYSSGTKTVRTTVSNFFDIQWRQLTTQYNRLYNNGSHVPAGTYRQLQSFTLDKEPLVVEGLVVDAARGGIGFRNHTLPVGMLRGATWSEDLLFMEPDVYCINQNVSIDYRISTSLGSSMGTAGLADIVLADRGGFVNINTTHPINDTRDGLNQPDLRMRALTAAWNFNRFTMFALNISNPRNVTDGTEPFEYINSEMGRTFKLPKPAGGLSEYQTIDFLQNFGEVLGFFSYDNTDDVKFDNPHNITSDYFTDTRDLCQLTSQYSPTALNSTYVACVMVRGVPQRTDGGQSTVFDDGSTWTSPLYTCAASVRAVVKTVTFFNNGTTSNLDNLKVQSIDIKNYTKESEMPLWGVEESFYQLGEWTPIWGIVHSAYEGFRNVSTIRQPWLYMLGAASSTFIGSLTHMTAMDNLAGSIAPLAAMSGVIGGSTGATGLGSAQFTAQGSLSLWLRWRELSSAAESLPLVFKLLWTDLAASAMVGAKGVLGVGNDEPNLAVTISARPTVHSVRYNYAYGVPAFLTGLALLVVLAVVLVSVVTGRSSLKIMDQRLKQTSLGRSITTVYSPETSTYQMSSKDWNKANGTRYLELRSGTATIAEEDAAPQQSGVRTGLSEHLYDSVPTKSPGIGHGVHEYRPTQ